MLLDEFDTNRTRLYESVMLTEVKNFHLGESFGRAIVEANLTVDQINQLFQDAQQQSGRTAIGKGVDAAKYLQSIYAELKTLIKSHSAVQNFDAEYTKLANSLKQATGGDQGVMRYVQKYRDFAKAHPTAQKVIYSTLVIGVGIAAAGLGGPAAVALKPAIIGTMKFADKLLQGEDFSTAAGAGLEVAAAGAIAQKIGTWTKSLISTGSAAPVDVQSGGEAGDADTQQPAAGGKRGAARFGASQYSVDQNAAGLTQGRDLAQKMGLPPNSEIKTIGGAPYEIGGKPVPNELLTPSQAGDIEAQRKMEIQMGNPDPLAGRPAYTGNVGAIMPAKDIPDTGTSAATGSSSILQPPADIRGNPTLSKAYTDLIAKIQNTPDYNARNLPNDIANRLGLDQRQSSALSLIVQKQGGGSMQGFLDSVKGSGDGSSYSNVDTTPGVSNAAKDKMWQSMGNQGQAPGLSRSGGATSRTGQFESIGGLSESQVNHLFMLVEAGMWDKVKAGAAAAGGAIAGSALGKATVAGLQAAGQKASQVGQALTNKVTADALMKAWQQAGSNTDSDAVADVMIDAGVPADVVKKLIASVDPSYEPPSDQYKTVAQQLAKLDPTLKQQLVAWLKQSLGQAPAAKPRVNIGRAAVGAVTEQDSNKYHVKENSVHGKVLANKGVAVITNYNEAKRLAERHNGTIKPVARGNYIVKMEDYLQPMKETDAPSRQGSKYDQELSNAKRFAQVHYPGLTPDEAFDKWVQRSLKHSDIDDDRQDAEIKALMKQVADVQRDLQKLKGTVKSPAVNEEEVWDKPNPVKNHKKLSPAKKASAKRRAKAAGRPYPNMVDNIWAAKS